MGVLQCPGVEGDGGSKAGHTLTAVLLDADDHTIWL
jgi:hypothetical protein